MPNTGISNSGTSIARFIYRGPRLKPWEVRILRRAVRKNKALGRVIEKMRRWRDE